MRYGSAPDPGINRNILECKGGCSWYVRKPVCVLIETYWNVKNNIRYSLKRRLSINRNILECKGKSETSHRFPSSVLIETYWNVKL